MALTFKNYESTELVNLGTVATNAGKDGAISLIDKNFKNPAKKVALVIKLADGRSTVVACSTAVSQGLREQSISLSQVQGFPILETNWDTINAETGKTESVTGNFVSMPNGSQMEDFKITEEATAYVVPTSKLDELVAL
tara:strand:+ start:87 stop:503 length:417 start_codon:yes stop_codon:yes gene_type:complete